MPRNRLPRVMKHCSPTGEGNMADLLRDFWIRETGTGQQVAQLHDRYDDDDDDGDDDDDNDDDKSNEYYIKNSNLNLVDIFGAKFNLST